MRKTLSIFLLIVVVLFSGCGSSNDDDPNPNPSGEITLTAISPAHVYSNLDITITGEGFSTTKTDNLIDVGTLTGDTFSSANAGSGFLPYEVVSATSTQLVIRAVDEEDLNLKIQSYFDYVIKVQIGDKIGYIPIEDFRNLVKFNINVGNVLHRVVGCFAYIQAGDSVRIDGAGFYGDCTMTIDGDPVPAKKDGPQFIKFKIPREHFGHLDDNCIENTFPVVITNEDGSSQEKMIHIATSPPMRITSSSFDKAIYGTSESNAVLTVKGYSLYSTAMLRTSSANGYVAESGVGWPGYPDEASVDFTIGALQPGTYNVQIKEGPEDDYGFSIASFQIQ